MHKIPISPLSQNLAWSGRRFRTVSYKEYDLALQSYFRTLDLPVVTKEDEIYLWLQFQTIFKTRPIEQHQAI